MTALRFFSLNSTRIARNCTVLIDNNYLTILSISSGKSATYAFRDSTERRAIKRMLERCGAPVAEILA